MPRPLDPLFVYVGWKVITPAQINDQYRSWRWSAPMVFQADRSLTEPRRPKRDQDDPPV